MGKKRERGMNDGIYTDVLLESLPDVEENEYIQELIQSLFALYEEFLYNRDGSSIDNDTSWEIRISGEVSEGAFSPVKASIEFTFIDEMNDVVDQTLTADFTTGNIYIMDDDIGCVYNINDESYMLYG